MSRADEVLGQVLENPQHAESCARALRALQYDCTALQVQNLARLARYLRGLPADYRHFNMNEYYSDLADSEPETYDWEKTEKFNEMAARGGYQHCGAVACAVGHGPAAGIPLTCASGTGEDWVEYEERAFGVDFHVAFFAGSWSAVDNTARGAAARIAMVLAHPENMGELTPEDADCLDLYKEYVE